MATAVYTVADAKTDQVAVSGKYRTLLPTDVTAASLADLGGAHQTGTFTIAANASPRQATFTVTTTPNTTVDGDRSFDVEIYDVTPVGTTLTVSKVRTKIVDDDATSGPTVVYGPQTTSNSGLVPVGSTSQRIEHTYKNAQAANTYMLCLDDNENGYALHQINDNNCQIRRVTAGSVGDPQSGTDPSIIANTNLSTSFADGDLLAVEEVAGKITLFKNGTAVQGGNGVNYPFTLPTTPAPGTNARFRSWVGSGTTNVKIIRK